MTRGHTGRHAASPRRRSSTGAERWIARFAAALLLLCASAVSASAQSVTFSTNPTSYSALGQPITYTAVLDPASRTIFSVSMTSQIQGVTLSCPAIPAGGLQFPATLTCTGTYQVSAFDMSTSTIVDFVQASGTGTGGGGTYSVTSNTVTIPRAGGGPVSVSVSSTPRPSQPGQTVTVQATVSAAGCNSGVAPPGNVTITIGTDSRTLPLVPDPLSPVSGNASFTTSSLPVGVHPVIASYPGGADCAPGSATGPDHAVDTPPAVTINQAGGQQDPTTASPIQFSVVFDKPVTGFTGTDVALSGTAGATTASVSGSGATYTVSVSGMTSTGTVIASIPAGRATSAAGFGNLASTSTDNTVSFALIVISPASLPGAAFGQAYSQTITASGGTTPFNFSVTSGALPGGLSLSTGGVLSGTPTATGTSNFTVTATDGAGLTQTRGYAIIVAPPTVSVTPANLPSATAGSPYTEAVSASGGTAPYSFSIAAGALPAGLTLASDGTLSGTPTATGTYNFTIAASDSTPAGSGGPFTGSQIYSLVVGVPSITLSPSALPNASAGTTYSQAITASGGTAPYAFTVTAGALPPGLNLASDGTLSGTPTAAGTFNFTVAATDSTTGGVYSGSRSYTLNVQSPNLTLSAPSFAGTQVGAPYTGTFVAGGGTAPYTFSTTAGSLPPGLTLSSAGTLSGTPTAGGTFSFTVVARDSTAGPGAPYGVAGGYTVSVAPAVVSVTPASLPNAVATQSYSEAISASGGTAPYSFAVTAGALPAGLSLAADGTLSGTPTATGTFTFTITATDSSTGSGPYSGAQAYALTVAAPTVVVSPSTLPGGAVGAIYTGTLSATGGSGPYTFAVSAGTLPSGVSLSPDGTLSGTPTAGGSFTFTVTATDSSAGSGPYSGSQSYTVTIASPTLAIAPSTLPDPVGSVSYSQTLSASGGTAPYSFSVTAGTLPTGLTLAANGTISGTPSAAGTFNFTVTATDSSTGTGPYSVSQAFTLTVSAPGITFVDTTLDPATVAVPYTETIAAQGGAAPYAYVVTSGSLPGGITLSTAGSLAGTPTDGGTFTFTVTATDSLGFTGAFGFSLTVAAPVVAVTPASLPNGTAGQAYSATVAASGGTAPYSFALTAGMLPPGIQLEANGAISGTPSTPGSYTFTITGTDGSSGTGPYSGSTSYSVTIVAPTVALAPATLPDASGSTPYSQSLSASGGTAPYVFTVSAGALPPGLALSPAGTISGTPTTVGSFSFTVQAADANGFTGSRSYSLSVVAPTIAIAPAALPDGRLGEAYTETLTASGGGAPYSFAVTGGSLPPGLLLSAGGTLAGTPTQRGSFSFTISVTDANGFAGSAAYTLLIEGEVPTVVSRTIEVAAGRTATVSLTDGATGGPFTAATLLGSSNPALGAATIEPDGADYRLVFAAANDASGQTVVSYTLSNLAGTSAPGTITFNILARPDPSKDAEVVGLITAQAESARRVADSQIRNFRDRLEQTHDEESRQQNAVSISLGADAAGTEPSAYANDGNAVDDPAALAALGYAMGETQGAAPPETQRRSIGNAAFWAGGFVNFGSREESGLDLDQTMVGLSAGVDYRFSPQFVGGIGIGYGRDRSDIGDNGTEGAAHAYSGAVYGSYSPATNLFLDALVGYSYLDFESRRFVTGQDEFADGERSGDQVFGSLTATYEYRSEGLLFAPYAGIEGSSSTLDAFTESGAGAFNLAFGKQDVTTISGLIGLRLEKMIQFDWGVLTPRGRLEYSHDFEGSDPAALGYNDLDGLPYGFDVDAFSRDRVSIGLGLDARFVDGWGLGIDYDTELGLDGDAQDHSVSARVSKQF